MAERKRCPECDAGNTYVTKGGYIVCRSCGYDGRKEKQEKPK
jgi:primosomal protein N'